MGAACPSLSVLQHHTYRTGLRGFLPLLQRRGDTSVSAGPSMTKQECRQLVETYVEWLRQGFSAESVGEVCELTTPFLDRHNDYLQIYAIKQNGIIKLSDDGYILSDLRSSGLELITPR